MSEETKQRLTMPEKREKFQEWARFLYSVYKTDKDAVEDVLRDG